MIVENISFVLLLLEELSLNLSEILSAERSFEIGVTLFDWILVKL